MEAPQLQVTGALDRHLDRLPGVLRPWRRGANLECVALVDALDPAAGETRQAPHRPNTDTASSLRPSNGSRFHPPHRSLSQSPAIRAIRSSSLG